MIRDRIEEYSRLRCQCCGNKGPRLKRFWITGNHILCTFCFRAWYDGGWKDEADIRAASLKKRKQELKDESSRKTTPESLR